MDKRLHQIWSKKSKSIKAFHKEIGSSELIERLESGALVAVGLRDDDFQLIPVEFWTIRWWVDYDKNTAWNKSASYRRVKCCETSALDSLEIKTERTSAWRTSKRLRMQAVTECASDGSVDLSGGVRSPRQGQNNIFVRMEVYFDWLSKSYPDVEFVDANGKPVYGFSDKSFARTEDEFKNPKS